MQVAQRTVVGLEVVVVLARLGAERPGRSTSLAELAAIPNVEATFVHHVLRHLRVAGLVTSRRGAAGGWALARPPSTIAVADVVVALDGALLAIDGDVAPDAFAGGGADQLLGALRHIVRDVLGAVTIADLVRGTVPASISELVDAVAAPAG